MDEKIESSTPKRVSRKRSLLMGILPWILAIIGSIAVMAKDVVQAQVVEDVRAVHELPLTKARIEHLEKDVDQIKKDVHEQRSDIKYLIRKFDKQYGSR